MIPDADAIRTVARAATGDPTASVADWSMERRGGGASEEIGQSDGPLRVVGVAHTAAGDRRWSAVGKTIKRVPIEIGGMNPDIDDPHHVHYWRREADAFASGVLETLGGNLGLGAPACYHLDPSDDEVTLWVEDVEVSDDGPWSIERYWRTARDLGAFNGHFTDRIPEAATAWASRGRLRDWLVTGGVGVLQMDTTPRPGLLGTWLDDDSVARTQRLYSQRDALLGLVERLPQTFCHHDAQGRNLLAVGEGPAQRTVAVDWAMAGAGHLGEDLAIFMGVPLQFLDVAMDEQVEFEAAVIDGYLAGLRLAGWTGDETVLRIGYKAALSLLMGVAVAGIWFRALSDPAGAGFAEHVIGRSEAEIAEQWARFQPYLLDLGEEALLSA